jgi:hypothetical protein
VEIEERFADALAAFRSGDEDPVLLPVHLARATVAALGVAGASLGVHGDAEKRTPLGASSDDAELAERLQFTAGAGPCMDAVRTGWPVLGEEAVLRERWPTYHDLLVTRTPFRTVVGLPLRGPLHGMGSLDLYLLDPGGLATVDAPEAMTTAGLVSEHLAHAANWTAWTDHGPAWMSSAQAEQRARVWVAMGMTSQALQVPTTDALALLRSFAYSSGRLLDDVAEDIASGRLPAQRLDEAG